MPYADPEKQKAAMRERYRDRYDNERGFRDKESERKATYYATNTRYASRVKRKAIKRYRDKVAKRSP